MKPNSASSGPRGQKKPAMDATATKDFYAWYDAEPTRRCSMGLAGDEKRPAETSRSAGDSFRQLFPEAEPTRHI
jgi:hypothetical protein